MSSRRRHTRLTCDWISDVCSSDLGPRSQHFRDTGLISGKMAIVLLVVNVATLAIIMLGSLLLPKAPDTNRRVRVPGSRFNIAPAPQIANASA